MPAAPPLVPATLAFDAGGTPFSERYGDLYHSADGGLAQARAVFLAGNGLPARWRGRETFVIVETGFGLGLNFLAAWQAWRDDPQRCARLHFVSCEKHPFRAADLEALHAGLPALAPLAQQLRAQWPPLVPGFQRLHCDGGAVTLTLLLGEAAATLPRLGARADAFFLDGFAPEKNPELWSPELMRRLARLAAPGATLATWSVAASVREALAAAGFETGKRPGFGRKREMLCGRYAGPQPTAPGPPTARRAIVIGAGIAGSSACERLAARGWEVEVIERQPPLPPGATPHIAGVFKPVLARDDNLLARLSRAGSLYAHRLWSALASEGAPLSWADCGVLQLARDAAHEAQQQALVESQRLPEDFASFVPRAAASRRAGWELAQGGLLLPRAGWINPLPLCRALLARHAGRLRLHQPCEAAAIEREDGLWRVRDAAGATIAAAPVLLLANAAAALRFPAAQGLPLRPVRGQTTCVPQAALPPLPLVVCREGCVTPPVAGLGCVGATFDADLDPAPRASSNEANLARLARLLPGAGAGLDPAALEARVGFRAATPDRLPLAGALPAPADAGVLARAQLSGVPRLPGLYGLLGYGARGLVWSALLAELLASSLSGEPLPLESDLAAAVDPARFLLRAQRRGAGSSLKKPC